MQHFNLNPNTFFLLGLLVFIAWFLGEPSWEPLAGIFLTSAALLASSLKKKRLSESGENHYACGRRLKHMRNQIGLPPSKMMELLQLESEFVYQEMEKGECEVPISTIEHLVANTGISKQWLLDGMGESVPARWFYLYLPHYYHYISKNIAPSGMFPIHEAGLYDDKSVKGPIREIFRKMPKDIFLCMNPESCRTVILVVNYGNHHWQLWDINALDFWQPGWIGEWKYIPHVFSFYQLLNRFGKQSLRGIYMTDRQLRRLMLGIEHPQRLIREALKKEYKEKEKGNISSNVSHWPVDLLDIKRQLSSEETYKSWYGDWFVRCQNCINDALAQFG